MVYEDVTEILNGNKELAREYSDISSMLFDMEKLSGILRTRRMAQGSIDFDFPEVKIVTDENGRAVDVYKY